MCSKARLEALGEATALLDFEEAPSSNASSPSFFLEENEAQLGICWKGAVVVLSSFSRRSPRSPRIASDSVAPVETTAYSS